MDDGALGRRGRDATQDASVQVPNKHFAGVADGIPRALQEGCGMRLDGAVAYYSGLIDHIGRAWSSTLHIDG